MRKQFQFNISDEDAWRAVRIARRAEAMTKGMKTFKEQWKEERKKAKEKKKHEEKNLQVNDHLPRRPKPQA